MNAFQAGLLGSRALALFVFLSLIRQLTAAQALQELAGANRTLSAVSVLILGVQIVAHLMLAWWLWVRARDFARWVAGDTLYEEAASPSIAYGAMATGLLGLLLVGMALPGFTSIAIIIASDPDMLRQNLLLDLGPHLAQMALGIALLVLRVRVGAWLSRGAP